MKTSTKTVLKVTMVSWTYPSGNRLFGKSEVDAMLRKRLLYRLITREYKVYDSDMNLIRPQWYFIARGLSILLKIITKVFNNINNRYYAEIIFDLFASHNIGNPDVLFSDKNNFPLVLKNANRRKILTIAYHAMPHYNYIEKLIRPEKEKYNLNSKFLFKKLNKRREKGLEEAKYIFATSKLVKNTDIEYGINHNKIKVVYGGVDTSSYKDNPLHNGDKFKVLFIGHGALLKGIIYLLEAWKILDIEDGELLIAGNMPIDLVQRYKSYKSIKFLGYVNNCSELYNNVSLLVHPALVDAGPKVVFEAMASGLPVVITEGIGQSEIITDGKEGFIVPIKDSQAIAEKIKYFYDNPNEIEKMGREARKTVERYSLEKHGNMVVEKILEIVNKFQKDIRLDYFSK